MPVLPKHFKRTGGSFRTALFFFAEPDTAFGSTQCFHIEKKHVADSVEATGKLSKQIARFIMDHYEDFLAYDDVKIYYDNGRSRSAKFFHRCSMRLFQIRSFER